MFPNCAQSGRFQETILNVYSLRAGLENADINFISPCFLREAALNQADLATEHLAGFCVSAIIYRLCTLQGARQEQFQHLTQVY